MVWVPEGKFSMGTAGFAKRLPCAKALCRLRDRRSCAEHRPVLCFRTPPHRWKKEKLFLVGTPGKSRAPLDIHRSRIRTRFSSHDHPINSPQIDPGKRADLWSAHGHGDGPFASLVNAFKKTVGSSDTRALALADHDSALWPALCFTPAETASLDLGRLKRSS